MWYGPHQFCIWHLFQGKQNVLYLWAFRVPYSANRQEIQIKYRCSPVLNDHMRTQSLTLLWPLEWWVNTISFHSTGCCGFCWRCTCTSLPLPPFGWHSIPRRKQKQRPQGRSSNITVYLSVLVWANSICHYLIWAGASFWSFYYFSYTVLLSQYIILMGIFYSFKKAIYSCFEAF